MDNTVMLGLQTAVAAAAVDASGGMTAVPEGGESFSAVLAQTTSGQAVQNPESGQVQVQNQGQSQVQSQAQNQVQVQAQSQVQVQVQFQAQVQDSSVVQDSQTLAGDLNLSAEETADVDDLYLPAEETADIGDLSLEAAEKASSKSALDVIIEQLEATEDNGTLKGMKILAKAVLNAMMGENSSKKKKTDMFAFMGEGYKLYTDDYDLFLTGTEMLSQIGIALKTDLIAAEENKSETGSVFLIDTDEEEDFISPIDEIISKLNKIVKKLYSADDDETDVNAAAEAVAALLDIPVGTDMDYVLTPVKEQAVEAAADVLTSAKEIVAEASPEDVPKMEQLYSETAAAVKTEKPEAEQVQQSSGIHEAFNVSFAAVKINNAADQLKAINGEEAAAAVAVNHPAVQLGNSVPETTEVSEETPMEPVEIESQVTEKISESLFEMKEDNGTEELVMVLKPENLGQVAIKLVKENGVVSVLLSAQYDEVGKLMAERAAHLGSSLQDRDVQVKSVEVVNPGSAAEQMGLDFTNQGFSFMRNFGGGFSNSDNRGSYRADGISEIDGADIIDATENIEIIREARLWTTA